MNFQVEFSNEHKFDTGTKYQTKIVRKTEDDITGIESKVTYYFWGTKKLQGDLELDIDKYNVIAKEVEIEGKLMTLKQIVGLK
jgi:hypothetical protein